jgi:hypothetical protein
MIDATVKVCPSTAIEEEVRIRIGQGTSPQGERNW